MRFRLGRRHVFLPLAVLLAAMGCDDDTTITEPEIVPVTVAVTPGNVIVALGQIMQFEATVTGTSDTTVTWSVDEGDEWGTIDSTGLYTAPETLPPVIDDRAAQTGRHERTVTIRATSRADESVSGAATVTFGPVSLDISPPHAIVGAGQTIQFQATVIGTSHDAVAWSVDGGEAWGTIDADGLYTAPEIPPFSESPNADPSRFLEGLVVVRAVSEADPSASDSATVSFGVPDFALRDLNRSSATFRLDVSPRDFVGSISVWYFAYATS